MISDGAIDPGRKRCAFAFQPAHRSCFFDILKPEAVITGRAEGRFPSSAGPDWQRTGLRAYRFRAVSVLSSQNPERFWDENKRFENQDASPSATCGGDFGMIVPIKIFFTSE